MLIPIRLDSNIQTTNQQIFKRLISALGRVDGIEELFEDTNDLEDIGLQETSRSGDEVRALCPFHSESKPSFYVNRITGAYYCHSCPARGGISSLIGRLAGAFVELSDTNRPKKQKPPMSRADYIGIACRTPASHPEEHLRARIISRTEDNLAKHRITSEECERYGIFSCSFSHLGRTGLGIVIPIGICKTTEEDVAQDLFQIRTITPGFPKYINNFDCSKTMFGLRLAMQKKRSGNSRCIIVTEGVFDAISLEHYVGRECMVVSSFGSRLSDAQLGFCLMMSDKIAIAYDNDENGAGDKFYYKFSTNPSLVSSIVPAKMYRCRPASNDFGEMNEEDLTIVRKFIDEV